jgi:hypothetical protein
MNSRVASLSFSCLAAGAIVWGVLCREPTDAADDVATPADRPDIAALMHGKMTCSQELLIGLINRDMEGVESAGQDLVTLAKSAAWIDATSDPVYSHFNAEFQRLSERIVRMARNDNPDGAAYAYQGLTTTCISCHEHVRDVSRLAGENEE